MMPNTDKGKSWTRDDQLQPDRPPRSANTPAHAKESAKTDKTQTDPATGAPQTPAPKPNPSDDRT